MGHVSGNAIGRILSHYADVIEGGDSYSSGTSFRGIPGTYSNDQGLLSGADTPLTSTGAGSTSTFAVAGGDWEFLRWVKETTPRFFAVCTEATQSANVGAARRITAWNNTTKEFTTDEFPATTTTGDVFAIRQGFKRIPNNIDIDADGGFGGGFDRFFHLRATSGEPMDWYGAGSMTYSATLELKIRFLKYAREWDAVAAAMENLAIIRPTLCRGASPDHRESTYTRALVPMNNAADIVKEDNTKIVVVDKYQLIYRIDTTFA